MPLLKRDTIIDRRTLVDRGSSGDEGDNKEADNVIETLGEGGGPVVNQIEFEQGDYAVVAASNLVAALSTAETGGEVYQNAFITSAIQLKEAAKSGVDITPLSVMSRDRQIDDLNITQEQMTQLKLSTGDTVPEDIDSFNPPGVDNMTPDNGEPEQDVEDEESSDTEDNEETDPLDDIADLEDEPQQNDNDEADTVESQDES
jgi:hypothetical protein